MLEPSMMTALLPLAKELKKTATTTATRMPPKKGLMRKTIAVHVRYKSLCISLSSSPKQQQREMAKFCVVYVVDDDG